MLAASRGFALLAAFLFRRDTDDDQLPFHTPVVFDTVDTHQPGHQVCDGTEKDGQQFSSRW
jgi:hypothetical protein